MSSILHIVSYLYGDAEKWTYVSQCARIVAKSLNVWLLGWGLSVLRCDVIDVPAGHVQLRLTVCNIPAPSTELACRNVEVCLCQNKLCEVGDNDYPTKCTILT